MENSLLVQWHETCSSAGVPATVLRASSVVNDSTDCIFRGYQMNRVMRLLFGAALLGSAIAASAADVAGNVTLATDYRFRGISQLNGEFSPAIQGGFDFATDMGFYIGTWASNVNLHRRSRSRPTSTADSRARSTRTSATTSVCLYYGYPQDNSHRHDTSPTPRCTAACTLQGRQGRAELLRRLLRRERQVLLLVHRLRLRSDRERDAEFPLRRTTRSMRTQAGLDGDDNYRTGRSAVSTK